MDCFLKYSIILYIKVVFLNYSKFFVFYKIMILFNIGIIIMFRSHQDSVKIDYDDLDFLLAMEVWDF